MRAEVRDDIISLDSFVAAKFKFEEYLEILKKVGNYCFLDQFKHHFKNGAYIASQMEEYNLIKTEALNNNYKYIYLTDTSMKYLILKDDQRDFSNISKNSISVIKVNKYPSEKVLMSSALKFALLMERKVDISKESVVKQARRAFLHQYNIKTYDKEKKQLQDKLEAIKREYFKEEEIKNRMVEIFKKIDELEFGIGLKTLEKEKNNLIRKINDLEKEDEELGLLGMKRKKEIPGEINELKDKLKTVNRSIYLREQWMEIENNIKKINLEYSKIKNELKKIETIEDKNKEIESKFEKIENKIINLYDKSKIIILFQEKRIQFVILDTGNTKTAYGYLKMINEIKTLDYEVDILEIVIISYSEKRAKSLEAEFKETQKEREKTLKIMEQYEGKAGVKREERSGWLYEPPQHYKKAEDIYYNTPEVKIILLKETWYMENYKKNISYSEGYIKTKDKQAIEELKERFKKENMS